MAKTPGSLFFEGSLRKPPGVVFRAAVVVVVISIREWRAYTVFQLLTPPRPRTQFDLTA